MGPQNIYWFLGGAEDPYAAGRVAGESAVLGDVAASGSRVALAVDVTRAGETTGELWIAASNGTGARRVNTIDAELHRDRGSLTWVGSRVSYSTVEQRSTPEEMSTGASVVTLGNYGGGARSGYPG